MSSRGEREIDFSSQAAAARRCVTPPPPPPPCHGFFPSCLDGSYYKAGLRGAVVAFFVSSSWLVVFNAFAAKVTWILLQGSTKVVVNFSFGMHFRATGWGKYIKPFEKLFKCTRNSKTHFFFCNAENEYSMNWLAHVLLCFCFLAFLVQLCAFHCFDLFSSLHSVLYSNSWKVFFFFFSF